MADDKQLTAAISKLSEVAERLAEGTSAATAPVGTAALAVRARSAQNAKVIGAFVVGALIAAMIVPNNRGGGDSVVASTAPTGAVTGAGGALGGEAPTTEPGAPTVSADGTTNGAPSAGTPAAGGTVAASGGTAGGTTATGAAAPTVKQQSGVQGVTDNEIVVGVVDLDSSDLATACPRCGNGPSKDGGAMFGLLKRWLREGKLPVHGKTIKVVRRQTTVLDTSKRRSACVELAQEVKPFVVLVNPVGTFDVAECLAKEFKQLTITVDVADDQLLAQTPQLYSVMPSFERILRNFAHWGHNLGLWKGQVIGLYSPADPLAEELLNRSLKPAMAQLGYKIEVEVKSDGQQSAALAVQRFRTAGVTSAILMSDQLAFQQAARNQGYTPKYPQFDIGYTFTDAVSDISFDPNSMDGNLGMRVKFWDWEKRMPATPKGNQAATECLQAYAEETGRNQLDLFENTSEIDYVTEACSGLQVLMKALQLAGPNLTQQTFNQAMAQIKGLQTSMVQSVTFAANRHAGGDGFQTHQFKASRWPSTGLYWAPVAAPQRFYVE